MTHKKTCLGGAGGGGGGGGCWLGEWWWWWWSAWWGVWWWWWRWSLVLVVVVIGRSFFLLLVAKTWSSLNISIKNYWGLWPFAFDFHVQLEQVKLLTDWFIVYNSNFTDPIIPWLWTNQSLSFWICAVTVINNKSIRKLLKITIKTQPLLRGGCWGESSSLSELSSVSLLSATIIGSFRDSRFIFWM